MGGCCLDNANIVSFSFRHDWIVSLRGVDFCGPPLLVEHPEQGNKLKIRLFIEILCCD